jgi:hypothetical protein
MDDILDKVADNTTITVPAEAVQAIAKLLTARVARECLLAEQSDDPSPEVLDMALQKACDWTFERLTQGLANDG